MAAIFYTPVDLFDAAPILRVNSATALLLRLQALSAKGESR